MNQPHEVIIYRSPIEKAQWDAYNAMSGEMIVGGLAWVIIFILIVRATMGTQFGKKHSYLMLIGSGIVAIPGAIVVVKLVMLGLRFI